MTDIDFAPPVPKNTSRGIGIVGCGWIASIQLAAYRDAGYNVVALTDIIRDKAEALRDAFYPDATVYSKIESLLADDRVEVVDITTHVDVRPALVRLALNAGRHVLSQKPFVIALDEGEELCALADERDVTLAVNQNGRWAPHFAVLLAAARAGTFGAITSADFANHWPHDHIIGEKEAFATMADLILYDFGIHYFDIIATLIKAEPTRVFAQVAPRSGQLITAPTNAQVLISFPDTLASVIFRGGEARGERGSYRVNGTDATMLHEGNWLGGSSVRVITGSADREESETIMIKEDWFGPGTTGTMGELLLSLDEHRAPSNTGRSAIKALELCFAAIESSRTGQPVIPGTVRRRPTH